MKQISRRGFLASTGATLFNGAIPQNNPITPAVAREAMTPPRSARPQNLVLFMPDELRADALACYGNPVAKTPNFDKLATQGTRLEQCHVSYPICGASRCSLLTGWPVSVRGHRSQQYFLRPDEPNLFRYLYQNGYDVFWFGKNDALAAETFDGSVTAWNFVDGKAVGEPRGNPRGEKIPEILPFLYTSGQVAGDPRRTTDYRFLQAGIRVLERTQADKPFCIFLPLESPHPPYNAPGDFGTMYSPSQIGDLLPSNLPGQPQFMKQMRIAYGMERNSPNDLKKIRAAYLGKVSYSDWLLGQLMEAMERTNHVNDTALLVLSDHGDYAGDYGLVEKWPSGMEDCLTHVPLIGRIPGGAQNHVVTEHVQQFDVMATCLDLCNVPARHTHFSRSLVPQLLGAAGDPQRAAFTEGGYNTYEPQCFEPEPAKGAEYYPRLHLHHSEPETVSRCAAVKTAAYKFVSRPQGDSEFYLLKDDPQQLHNRFGESSVAAAQQEAEQRLLHWYVNTTGISPWRADSRNFPPYIPTPDFSSQPTASKILDL